VTTNPWREAPTDRPPRWAAATRLAVGDYDGDGHVDLFAANYGPDRLLRNRGDGTFEDVTAAAGVGDDGWSTGAAFLDFDGDGHLDLFVVRYVAYDVAKNPRCIGPGQPARLLRPGRLPAARRPPLPQPR
jgi:hypothetical protein